MSANDKRNSNRLGIRIDVRMTLADGQEYILKSQNLSDTGIFLELGEHPSPAIGSQVTLVVCATMDGEPAPAVKAEIVRCTDEGIGLRFIL